MEEIKILKKNETLDVTKLSRGKTLVIYKRIFKIKYKADGTIERYNIGLVVKGFM